MTKPVLTLTLNPALDMTVSLRLLAPGVVNKATAAELHAAGKGLNVAKVLHDLDQATVVSGFLGEDNHGLFKGFCERLNIDNQFLYLPGATRINVKISEQEGRVTDINLPGLPVPESQWHALQQRLTHLASQSSAVVLAGSLPPGLPTDAYALLINSLKSAGVPVILDTSGAAFSDALTAVPNLVKPNVDELEEWRGEPIRNDADLAAAAKQLMDLGIEHVVISDGANGCYWFTQDLALKATPPKVQVLSTVGAGDSLVAGLTFGLVNGLHARDTLTLACAVSAHAVEQVGVGFDQLDRIEELKTHVKITPFQPTEAL